MKRPMITSHDKSIITRTAIYRPLYLSIVACSFSHSTSQFWNYYFWLVLYGQKQRWKWNWVCSSISASASFQCYPINRIHFQLWIEWPIISPRQLLVLVLCKIRTRLRVHEKIYQLTAGITSIKDISSSSKVHLFWSLAYRQTFVVMSKWFCVELSKSFLVELWKNILTVPSLYFSKKNAEYDWSLKLFNGWSLSYPKHKRGEHLPKHPLR